MSREENRKERCFVIMPISDQGDYPPGHFSKVYDQIFKPAIIEAGYEPFRVDEDKISSSIIGKIFDEIQSAPIALCDLSNRTPNVLYELGLRQAYDKPVVLVKDEKTTNIFDVSGINTVMYSSSRLYETVMEDRKNITEAIKATMAGKTQTIIKIVKAEKAQYSSEKLSEQESVGVLLSSIMNELSAIKKAQEENSISQISYTSNMYRATRILYLKNGVTNKRVLQQFSKIREMGVSLSSQKQANHLVIDLVADTKENLIRAEIMLSEIADRYECDTHNINM